MRWGWSRFHAAQTLFYNAVRLTAGGVSFCAVRTGWVERLLLSLITMKTSCVRPIFAATALLATASAAFAHPGHEGDHGLTWEFSHLAAHPVATVLCGAVLLTAVAGVAWLARSQSLRKSAVRRGK